MATHDLRSYCMQSIRCMLVRWQLYAVDGQNGSQVSLYMKNNLVFLQYSI